MDIDRRDLLAASAAWYAAGVAGCLGGPTGGDGSDDDGGSTDESELDLREANVTAVAFEETDDGVRFDVTLYHDDDGEDGYANWWQVETLTGERLGRRELAHAHETEKFTRSETVSIPDDVTCVAVRGHDQTHGYGGRAMLANLDSAARAVDQGSDRRPVSADDCP